MRKNIVILTAVLLLGGAGWIGAHPHMWIDSSLEFDFTAVNLSAVGVTWVFDEASSTEMIPLYDSNGDGKIEGGEVGLARDEGFSHLLERSYFTRIAIDGTPLSLPEATDFRAAVDEGRLVYRFVLPVAIPTPGGPQGVVISQFDDTYFVEFRVDESRLTVKSGGRARATARVVNVSRVSAEGWEVTEPEIRLSIGER